MPQCSAYRLIRFPRKSIGLRIKNLLLQLGREFSVSRVGNSTGGLNKGTAISEGSVSNLTAGHRVGDVPLCPASVFIELVAAGATLALKHLSRYQLDAAFVLNESTFTKPLTIIPSGNESMTNLRISVDTMASVCSFGSCGSSSASSNEVTHAEGRYALLGKAEAIHEFKDLVPTIDERIRGALNVPPDSRGPKKFSSRTIYDLLLPWVVEYSQELQTIQGLTLSSSGLEAIADVRIDVGFQSGTFFVDILLADTLLHVPGLVANLRGTQSIAYVCSEIGSLIVMPGIIDRKIGYMGYCKASDVSDGMLCESYAFCEGQMGDLVAMAWGVRFQRVILAGLKFNLANHAGLTTVFSPKSEQKASDSDQRTLDDIEATVVDIIARADIKDVRGRF